MRNSNSNRDLTAVDQVEARLALSFKPGRKTQRIIGEAAARRSAANGFHGVQPLLAGQSFAEKIGLPAQIARALCAKENIPGSRAISLRLIQQPDQKAARIAEVDEYGDRGGMPQLRIAPRLHSIKMLRIAHIQFVERKPHLAISS